MVKLLLRKHSHGDRPSLADPSRFESLGVSHVHFDELFEMVAG